MNIIKRTQRRDGTQRVTVELARGEELPNVHIDQDGHYKLGYPVEEVMSGQILVDASRVHWCSASQQWVQV